MGLWVCAKCEKELDVRRKQECPEGGEHDWVDRAEYIANIRVKYTPLIKRHVQDWKEEYRERRPEYEARKSSAPYLEYQEKMSAKGRRFLDSLRFLKYLALVLCGLAWVGVNIVIHNDRVKFAFGVLLVIFVTVVIIKLNGRIARFNGRIARLKAYGEAVDCLREHINNLVYCINRAEKALSGDDNNFYERYYGQTNCCTNFDDDNYDDSIFSDFDKEFREVPIVETPGPETSTEEAAAAAMSVTEERPAADTTIIARQLDMLTDYLLNKRGYVRDEPQCNGYWTVVQKKIAAGKKSFIVNCAWNIKTDEPGAGCYIWFQGEGLKGFKRIEANVTLGFLTVGTGFRKSRRVLGANSTQARCLLYADCFKDDTEKNKQKLYSSTLEILECLEKQRSK
jgi:hypothetical protein